MSIFEAPAELASLTRGTSAGLLFFSSTTNQTSSLAPVADAIKAARWIQTNQAQTTDTDILRFPNFVVSCISLLTLPISLGFLLLFIFCPGGTKSSLRLRARIVALSFDELLRSFGYYFATWLLVRRHRVRILVMSNDHNSVNRAFCLAGRRLGIETIYIQHAPVSHLFPALIFSRAFLDGNVSADIYREKQTDTVIEVIGAARYDERFQFALAGRESRSKVVSLCLNKLDNRGQFLKYCQAFSSRGWEVIVRPHPGMSQGALAFLPDEIEIDRANIVRHLRRVSFLVAGSSGVLLDAYMAGVVPLMATDLSAASDYYGFLERGAVYPLEIDSLEMFDAKFQTLTLRELQAGMTEFNAAIGASNAYDVSSKVRKHIDAICGAATA